MPEYMVKVPWYYGHEGQATLKHQRVEEKAKEEINNYYSRGKCGF